jgi:hypothetical protein
MRQQVSFQKKGWGVFFQSSLFSKHILFKLPPVESLSTFSGEGGSFPKVFIGGPKGDL